MGGGRSKGRGGELWMMWERRESKGERGKRKGGDEKCMYMYM